MAAHTGRRYRTLPFNIIDEAFLHSAEPGTPLNIECEYRLAGRLDEERLRSAIDEAIRLHPIAGARLAPWKDYDREYRWELVGAAEHDPFAVRECASDTELDTIRSALLSEEVPLDSSPPFRVLLARGPESDTLLLSVDHAAMDGVGSIRLARSIGLAYCGAGESVDSTDLRRLRSFDRPSTTPLAFDWWKSLPWIHEANFDAWTSPPSRIAPDGATDRDGYGSVHDLVPAEAMRALQSGKGEATLNDVLLAALSLAIERWNTDHGWRTGRILLPVPLNLRPAALRSEIVSNLSISAFVSTTAEDRRSLGTALRCIAGQTSRIKAAPDAASMIGVYQSGSWMPLAWKRNAPWLFARATGNRYIPTALLSNVGKLDDAVDFGSDAAVTAIFGSAPAAMPVGLAVGVGSVGGSMSVSVRHHHRLMSGDAAKCLLGVFRTVLADAR
jgi:NRPS condensation-like uncharacterized protein